MACIHEDDALCCATTTTTTAQGLGSASARAGASSSSSMKHAQGRLEFVASFMTAILCQARAAVGPAGSRPAATQEQQHRQQQGGEVLLDLFTAACSSCRHAVLLLDRSIR